MKTTVNLHRPWCGSLLLSDGRADLSRVTESLAERLAERVQRICCGIAMAFNTMRFAVRTYLRVRWLLRMQAAHEMRTIGAGDPS